MVIHLGPWISYHSSIMMEVIERGSDVGCTRRRFRTIDSKDFQSPYEASKEIIEEE